MTVNHSSLIRAVLETDRAWSVYALGDLEPPHAAFAEWQVAADRSALTLLYREFGTPVLFTLGPPASLAPLLNRLEERELYLLLRPDVLPLIEARATVRNLTPMWRMLLGQFTASESDAERLGPEAFAELEQLYADGRDTHEAPDFFIRAQVERGVFYGVREADKLIAAAGTHLVSTTLGIGALGNVYVRRDQRRRGLGARVTAAVTAELLRMGLPTIALNVKQDNAAAIRVYERLGFRRYCEFYEGLAVRT
jgi:ribosomal protein S18 acetylase RimI-like enzyme